MQRFLVRLRLLLGALFILVLAQAFTGGLNLASLEKTYTNSIISGYETVGFDYQLKLQEAVKFGKPLDKLLGVDTILSSIGESLSGLSDIMLLLPNGEVVYSLSTDNSALLLGAVLSEEYGKQQVDHAEGRASVVIKDELSRHIIFPIHTPSGELAGMLVFSFPESLIRDQVEKNIAANLRYLTMATIGASLLLILGLWLFLPLGPQSEFSTVRLAIILALCLGGAQLFYSAINAKLFRDEYISVTKDTTGKMAGFIQRDVEFLMKKGITVQKLSKIEERFMEIINAVPEVESISVLDADWVVLNKADRDGPVTLDQEDGRELTHDPDPFYDLRLPLNKRDKSTDEIYYRAGYINVLLSKDTIDKRVREILLDGLTVLLISGLFLIEMVVFLMVVIRKPGASPKAAQSRPATSQGASFMLGRPVAFVFLFAWALPVSFIPLQMRELYEPMLGLSKDLILGLPISMEMLCALISAIISGAITDKRGWHLPFLGGLLLSAGGSFLSGAAQSGTEFILFRGMVGFGYGLSWMAVQGFIYANTSHDTRAQGISHLVAGIFSGHICGTAVGAMLADRVGYEIVFYVGTGLFIVPLFFSILFMRSFMHRPEARPRTTSKAAMSDFLRMLLNRNYFAIILLSIIPFSICQVGLLYYAAPIYLNELGINQSSIGRVLMIYGLSVVCLAPLISKQVDRSRRKSLFIVAGGLVGGLGLLSLYHFSGFTAVLAAVFLLGLSSSLAGAAQSALALKLKIIHTVGTGKAMSFQRAADKLGQMTGPLLVGAMVASIGIENGVAVTGAIFVVATLLFLLISKESAIEDDSVEADSAAAESLETELPGS